MAKPDQLILAIVWRHVHDQEPAAGHEHTPVPRKLEMLLEVFGTRSRAPGTPVKLGADDVAFGYLTTSIVVCDADAKQANEKLLAVERIINGRGFATIRESLNAVEAWLGSRPVTAPGSGTCRSPTAATAHPHARSSTRSDSRLTS